MTNLIKDYCVTILRFIVCCFARSFAKLPRQRDSEVTFAIFESSATYYYQSNHSKVEAIPLSAFPKDTTSELADLSSHKPF